MLSLIDQEPMRPSWGRVWQSGEVGAVLHHGEVPNPRLTVSMIGVFADPYSHLSLAVSMEDVPMNDGQYPTLPDETLLAMTQMIVDALACGLNVIIHCLEGVYRSTYMDAAVHMAVLGQGADQALGRIRQAHGNATLRPSHREQLQRMAENLHAIA